MNRQIRHSAYALAFGLALTGCSLNTAGFQSLSSASGGSGQAITPVDPIVATNKDIATLNTNISGLNTNVSGTNGQLDLITLLNLQTQATTGGSTLAQSLGKLLDNLVAAATQVYAQINLTKTNIQSRIALLNPKDPTQAQVIAQLQTLQTDISNFKTQVDTAVNNLAAKMVTLEANIDNGIANMSSSDPVLVLLEILWVPIKAQIQQHHDALVALTQ